MNNPADPSEQVMQTERRWVQAHRLLNVTEIEDILDESYMRIEADGTVVGKADAVASYQSGERRWDTAEASDYTVQVFSNFAVVVGTWHGVGVNHGERFDYIARFLTVYVKRAGGWKLYREETFDFDS